MNEDKIKLPNIFITEDALVLVISFFIASKQFIENNDLREDDPCLQMMKKIIETDTMREFLKRNADTLHVLQSVLPDHL